MDAILGAVQKLLPSRWSEADVTRIGAAFAPLDAAVWAVDRYPALHRYLREHESEILGPERE